jgi:D-glycero-alpha-D-manno-heptose 1-phosphate guanylyltransferase
MSGDCQKLGRKITTAIILAGGRGTRLGEICRNLPKPMFPILGRPFLDYIVEYLARQEIHKVIISSGYLGQQIESFFKPMRHGVSVDCVRESEPLGTGGALVHVARTIGLPGRFLVLNGDSLVPFRLERLVAAVENGAGAAMVGVRVRDTRRFGSLLVDDFGLLAGFREKAEGSNADLINGGVYLLPDSYLPREVAPKPASLERDYFPSWLALGKRIAVVREDGPFLDIGTPESLSEAAPFIAGFAAAQESSPEPQFALSEP